MLKELLDKLSFTPTPLRMYSAGVSDIGQHRPHNEDSFLIDEKLGLFIVADGIGGHKSGEVASKLAIESIFNFVKKQVKPNTHANTTASISSILQDAIEEANNQTHCYNVAKGLPEGGGMGTTITGFWMNPAPGIKHKRLHTFNVGDSRLYRFSDEKLVQLSTDHSHYQLWIDTGRDGPAPTQNIIYKAIGPWNRIIAEQQTYSSAKNELYLLCSDGLSDMLSDLEIYENLHKNRKKTLHDMAQELINAANKAGGKDNITVILVNPK